MNNTMPGISNGRAAASLAAAVQGLTYLAGLLLMLTWLMPRGFLAPGADHAAWSALVVDHQDLLVMFYTVVYLVNGAFLVVLSVCLADAADAAQHTTLRLLQAFGLVWAALVLGAGMIAVAALQTVVPLCMTDPAGCVAQWQVYATLVNALGGGIEVVGGAWFLLAAVGLRRAGFKPEGISRLALVPALVGLLSLWPGVAETAGAVFGLSAMVWFLWLALALRRHG